MAQNRSVDEYLVALMDSTTPLDPVEIPSINASHLSHLAEDVVATLPIPKFDNSAVDGYAILKEDIHGSGPWTFLVGGDTAAGAAPVRINNGKAIRVMTGGPIPPTDKELVVVPVELTNAPADHSLPDEITINQLPARSNNIRLKGEHLQPGDVAVSAGTPLDAGTIAAVISVGAPTVSAHPDPKVVVVTTGDELVKDNPWGIPNSNGPMLIAELKRLGVVNPQHVHSDDNPEALEQTFDKVAEEFDLIITVGGISAGAFDVVKAVGTKAGGFEFLTLAMKPGKPQGHGHWNGTKVVCLPGNPVAAWVSFNLFVVPVLKRLGGGKRVASISELPLVWLSSARALGAREGMVFAVPVTIDWATRTAHSVEHRSHMVGALAGSDGLALVTNPIAEGEHVQVLLRQI
ncbi:molybdopterin biosynthesis enzyme [Corynebacterium suranareeae]|uniref:Molybdopterin molybdenumtransferase n=1 Tax=Corynebacterium suranareeae TaxID=2506452 RepID=A0A160PNX0_9CORY|nr:molybdopterin molybdotransferase MoeA [Corynebacterium suranareeae]BAU95579.1 molybdopterin biosynthesis enzyme [Corynebacterium suranareeae]